jgi:hypothetical protein
METAPGTVIHHTPASSGCYVGCPSIVVLPGGDYVASHSYFGPRANNTDSFVYRSADRGVTWRRIAMLSGQIWSGLFLHGGALYIMGTDHCDNFGGRHNGRIVIRRSEDGGHTWTAPVDSRSGLITDEEGWHTAPVPVAVHNGRVWRGFEFGSVRPEVLYQGYFSRDERLGWTTVVLSAAGDADLLDRASWRFSEHLQHLWSKSQWIEGNVVVTPEGGLVDVLRTNPRGDAYDPGGLDRGAIVHVADDGVTLAHDPHRDAIDMPGGGTKFTIRRSPRNGRYYALVNPQKDPPAWRNILSLASSPDLRTWRIDAQLLSHPDRDAHAFQYVDWAFDGDDIIYASRTAYDDGVGGAHRAHDANYLTFHRLPGYATAVSGCTAC